MPSPSELPIPPGVAERLEPEDAQEASYLAASARISSFCCTFIIGLPYALLDALELLLSISRKRKEGESSELV